MTDGKINLPPFLIAELYKNTLVEVEKSYTQFDDAVVKATPVTPIKKEIATIEILGENKKQVIVLVNETSATFLSEDELALLANILKACNLTLQDIGIINIAAKNTDYTVIKNQLHPRVLLLFDVDPSAIKLPFLIPAFQVQKYDECTIVVAPPLFLIKKSGNDSKLLKTKLWVSLKQVFNIS